MRVIGGRLGGRSLCTREGTGTRPPLEAVRQAIFNMLQPHLDQARVLDLFAGSGSMGIEAISRGASSSVMVESNRAALKCCHENIKTLELEGVANVLSGRLPQVLEHAELKEDLFDLILIDPPFDAIAKGMFLDLDAKALPLLTAKGRIVVRLPESSPPIAITPGLILEKERRYGISVVQIKRRDNGA